jgi:hypothetical protein
MVSPYRALCGSKCLPSLGCPLRYCPHLALRIMPGAMGALAMRLCAVASPAAYTSLGSPHHRTPLKRCVSVLWAASLLPRKCSCLDHYSCFIPNSCAPRRSPTESQQPVQIMSDQLCASGQPGAMRGRCTESAHWRQGGYGTVLGWRCRWRPKSKVHPVERLLCRSSLAHRRAQGARPCSPACSPTKPAPPARVRIRQQLMP